VYITQKSHFVSKFRKQVIRIGKQGQDEPEIDFGELTGAKSCFMLYAKTLLRPGYPSLLIIEKKCRNV